MKLLKISPNNRIHADTQSRAVFSICVEHHKKGTKWGQQNGVKQNETKWGQKQNGVKSTFDP